MTSRFFAASMLASCALLTPVIAADQQTHILTVTITDIGRPYTVIDGACAYGKVGFASGPGFEEASVIAINRLVATVKANGGDALVGMQATPISESTLDRNGVLVCGTVVKFKN